MIPGTWYVPGTWYLVPGIILAHLGILASRAVVVALLVSYLVRTNIISRRDDCGQSSSATLHARVRCFPFSLATRGTNAYGIVSDTVCT